MPLQCSRIMSKAKQTTPNTDSLMLSYWSCTHHSLTNTLLTIRYASLFASTSFDNLFSSEYLFSVF